VAVTHNIERLPCFLSIRRRRTWSISRLNGKIWGFSPCKDRRRAARRSPRTWSRPRTGRTLPQPPSFWPLSSSAWASPATHYTLLDIGWEQCSLAKKYFNFGVYLMLRKLFSFPLQPPQANCLQSLSSEWWNQRMTRDEQGPGSGFSWQRSGKKSWTKV